MMGLCGYNGGYMPDTGINNLIDGIQNVYPGFCKIINLEASREGRPIRAIKMGKGSGADRRGVLLVGGIHARELLNPDALIYFAFNLAYAYSQNKDFVLGNKTYTAAFVKMLIENMDIYILPLANPDGRVFVLAANGDRMWRGNRAPNPGKACKGVDINRNFDFLWTSGIMTSSDPCNASQIYKGPSAFSEPETRNVRKMLDDFPNISGMIDVHSYSEDILYPWGDDENQTNNTNMNFKNAAFNGQRGTTGDAYKEYIPKADLDWLVSVGNNMKQGIAAVRGKNYVSKQSVGLYPTSATSDDYSYSRHYVNNAKRKVFAYCIETGPLVVKNGVPDYLKSFQPDFPEASCIMEDVQPAFMEFCVSILSASSDLVNSLRMASQATSGKAAGKASLSRTGSRFAKLLDENRDELMELARGDTRLWRQSLVALKRVLPVIQSHQSAKPKVIDEALVKQVDEVLGLLGDKGSPKLRRAMQSIRKDLQPFVGKTMLEGFKAADKSKPRKAAKSQSQKADKAKPRKASKSRK
ncbi:MAG TPA: M14 family zinc carboxypeptidase [Pyrinomonadaceae bacterium]|jgi:murein tripeptide amidase MpaA